MPSPRNFTRITSCLCAVLICGQTLFAVDPLNGDALIQSLDTLLDQHPTAERTTVTLKVIDLESGNVLYDRGGGKLLIPASNLKIYTAAAALSILGPEYRWTTEVASAKPIQRGICHGGLVIHGTGDPMLDTDQLGSLADDLVEKHKLTKVLGGVRVATSPRWENVPLKGPGWMWDDDPDYYNMSIRSVMLNFNTIKFMVSPGKDGPVVKAEPSSVWPRVEVILRTPDGKPSVRFERDDFDETIRITAVLSKADEPKSDTITMHDPSPWIASVFTQMLIDRGVAFVEEKRFASGYDNILASMPSKTLAEALKHFLKVSENAVGEMVLLKLAETQAEGDVSWPAGAKVISDWLVNAAGLEEGSFRIVDGSGLSRYNLVSADSSVRLLAYMKQHEHFQPFFDGLPAYKVALPDKEKWGGVPLAEFDPERVFAKPGGMSGVSTISGYVKTLDDRWLAFSFLANGYIGSNKPVIELRNAVWSELIRYRSAGVEAEKPVTP